VNANNPRYDRIGHGYASTRREEPRIAARIQSALGDARTVVNVGAGAGSYEPRERQVIAIEPSDVMAAQRPRELAPAIRASAHDLPLRDASVDAALSVLSLHHWDDQREQGVRELRRVARGPVVLVTCDPHVSCSWWLMSDYLPEVAALDGRTFPSMSRLAGWLGGTTSVEVIPIPRDCTDWMLLSFWAHPERVLDPIARNATSGFARLEPAIVERCVESMSRDLASGLWHERHGHLRALDEFDAGLRLVVSTPSAARTTSA
jgi:SAM-dependent methyltransferase